MWDRFRQREGTAPILDRKRLEAWQNAHSLSPSTSIPRGVTGGNGQYQYVVRGGPAPKWPPKDVGYPPESAQPQNSNYLTAPPVLSPRAGRNPQRDSSYGRPTSSVYSQPSPEAAVFAAQQLRNDLAHQRPNPLEISPPSSPDIASPREGPYPGDVSPIDETPGTYESAPSLSPEPVQERQVTPKKNENRSNIPMMRRERRKNSDAIINSLRESKSRERTAPPRPYGHDVRWDPGTGEPTTSVKGRPSQVNPQEYAHGLTNREAAASSFNQSGQSPPNNPASLRDRLRQVRQTSASSQPEAAPRPEWRGASGRTAIVPPVRDNKLVTPLRIPPRSDKRANRGLAVLSPVESTGSGSASSPLQAAPRGTPSHEHKVGDATPNSLSSPPATYPTPPLSEDTVRSRPPLVQGPVVVTPSQPPPLHIPSNDKAIRRKPARVSSGQYPERSTPSEYSQHDTAPSQALASGHSEWTQPPSRFSITTYATSNPASTPRIGIDDEEPPFPAHPQLGTPTPAPQPTSDVSILDRGRPFASSYEDSPNLTPTKPIKISLETPFQVTPPLATAMSPAPPGLRALARLIPEGNHSTLSVASILSLDKSLPPAPPEASAKDRVAELNAQLEALGNRRININTAIRKMTEMMPTDNVLASEAVVRKREEEKRKVETLRTELAEVERQAYELGLKLHRAYKRLDRDAEYEPTTLWVRRVTG